MSPNARHSRLFSVMANANANENGNENGKREMGGRKHRSFWLMAGLDIGFPPGLFLSLAWRKY